MTKLVQQHLYPVVGEAHYKQRRYSSKFNRMNRYFNKFCTTGQQFMIWYSNKFIINKKRYSDKLFTTKNPYSNKIMTNKNPHSNKFFTMKNPYSDKFLTTPTPTMTAREPCHQVSHYDRQPKQRHRPSSGKSKIREKPV